jgi:peptide/nickel transport system ATP-binding protein
MVEPVLDLKNLRFYYHTEAGPVKAVDDVSFQLMRGSSLGLVGESGCGKSTTAMAIMRLLKPPGNLESGEMILDGIDLARLTDEQMQQTRLQSLSLIPQGAMNSLNPVLRVGSQILDGLVDHNVRLSTEEKHLRLAELLDTVELPRGVAGMFPHELSGGMKQRVCIAIAISMKPKLVIADEPTSALDVVVQRQIMATIDRLRKEMGISLILIGHDMGLMAQTVDRLGVMYAGRLAELGDVVEIIKKPAHPYTRMLIKTLPLLAQRGHFEGIPGITPSLLNPPGGCLFAPRCPHVMPACTQTIPSWDEIRPGHWVACHLGQEN